MQSHAKQCNHCFMLPVISFTVDFEVFVTDLPGTIGA
jgi:hypothetical protein